MRFTPYPRGGRRQVTRRRLAHARRTLERERAGWGMFADQMEFETPEERIDRLDADLQDYFQGLRDHNAAMWRRGRRALFCLPPERHQELIQEWNRMHWMPGTCEYFLDFLSHKGVNLEEKG